MFTPDIEGYTESFYSVTNCSSNSFVIFILVMVIVALLVDKYRKE